MLEAVTSLVALAGAGLTPSAAIVAVRRRDGRRWAADLAPYRLEVSSSFEAAGLQQFLAAMTGLLPSRWAMPLSVRGIGLEVVATSGGVLHFLLVPRGQVEIVLGQLRASVPGIRITAEDDYRPAAPTLAGELGTPQPNRQLRVDDPAAVAAGILTSLQPLEAGEQMIVSWLMLPVPQRRSASDGNAALGTVAKSLLVPTDRPRPQQVPKASDKHRHPQFVVAARLGVTSSSPARDRVLLGRLTASFHNANSPEAALRRRPVPSRRVIRALVARRPPLLARPCILNSAELAGLLALPPRGISLPGLRTAGSRQLAPSSDIATTGLILADATYPGLARPIALSIADSLMHLHIIGPTGGGKTSLIVNLIVQLMEAGYGVVFIDPKRDGVEDALDRVPLHRQSQVAVLDPLDDWPIGINILQSDDDPDLAAERIFAIIHKLNRESWGPRLANYLRAALHTLARMDGATLVQLVLLLTDAAYRQRVIGSLDDPIGLGAVWASFDALSEAERTQAIAPILNKVQPWIMTPRLRHVLGQAEPRLDLDDVLAEGQILFVPLSTGELGADAAALLGAVVMEKVSQAIMRRVRLPRAERRPVFVFVDEAQMLENVSTPLPDLLATARAMGASLCIAHQTLSQFDPKVREALLGTARSRVIFQTGATDARRLAQDLSPHLGAEDLRGLGAFEVVATLATGGHVAPPVTGRTRPLPPGNGQAERVRQLSRERWGRDRAEVEAELRRRQERPTGSGPVGRQRRSR